MAVGFPWRSTMRAALCAPVLAAGLHPRRAPDSVRPNPNTTIAGVLEHGVLSVALEAKQTIWRPDGDDRPGMTIEAFAEEGKAPLHPGPLIRVPRGTEVRLRVRNSLALPIALLVPAAIHGATSAAALDTLSIAAGDVGEVSITAAVPGNYIYRGTTKSRASGQLLYTGLLAGAIVVDSASAPPPRDRIFVMMMTADSLANTALETGKAVPGARLIFTMNGLPWPRSERLAATVGDSLHWRVLNASNDVHPMHLHGSYFRVDEMMGPSITPQGQGAPGRMAVTERMPPFSSMSITWSPERPGNWLFHCHFALHNEPPPNTSADSASHAATNNHALTGMVGLMLGVSVAPRTGAAATPSPQPVRRLRLTAVRDTGFPEGFPSMRFVVEDLSAGSRRAEAGPGFSPTIYLTRNEPVSITVVNQLIVPTAVHWHGVEVESYNDGVPGFSGTPDRLSPIIPPGGSFEARFTPPRSGTFMYHSHVNELRQHTAGLVGALIVRDAPASAAATDDHVFFIKGARDSRNPSLPLEINGTATPDTVVFHLDKPARLRFMSLATLTPNATVWLTARPDSSAGGVPDSMVVRWRPLAKDGFDLPTAARALRLARQLVSMGETFDFEYLPTQRGNLRIELRAGGAAGQLYVRVPVRVE